MTQSVSNALSDGGQQMQTIRYHGARATDPTEARRIWREFTVALQEVQPFTFMFWLDELAASGTAVTGVEMDPRGELQSMREWSVR